MRYRSILRVGSGLAVLATLSGACSSPSQPSRFGARGSNAGGDDGSGDNGGQQVGSLGPVNGSSGGADGGGANGPVDVTPPCDSGLAIDGDATAFARAIGICQVAAKDGFGLVSASYASAFGATTPPASGQWGLLPKFGGVIQPREGASLGALSSGFAREYDDATGDNQGQTSDFVPGTPMAGTAYPTGAAPPGFPKAAQGCTQDDVVNDMIDVRLVLKAPPDASGFQFDFDFFSSEWPNYVCSNFNDAFVAYLTSSQTTDNVSYDAKHNPVAVNISFLDRCTPGTPLGCLRGNGGATTTPLSSSVCAAGPAELGGTGFGDTAPSACQDGNVTATLGASTGWLVTSAPVKPGEQFTLDLMIWDAGDAFLDSSVLVDHFQWLGGNVSTGTTPVK